MLPRNCIQLFSFALIIWVSALGAILISCSNSAQTVGGADRLPFVAVMQLINQPTLNQIRDGLEDALAEAGYTADSTLRWEWLSSQGNPIAAAQIASKYAAAKPDVIVAIATPMAQAAVNAAGNIPVIFSAVSDPVSANLIEAPEKPNRNISGVSNAFPVEQSIALIREVLPEAKTLGVVYSATEGNAVNLLNLIRAQAPEQGFITVKEVIVGADQQAIELARSMIGSVDAIYVLQSQNNGQNNGQSNSQSNSQRNGQSNSVVGLALVSAVAQVGRDNDVPVFAGGIEGVKSGAITGISLDYYAMGRQTGEMVLKVLRGDKASDLPVELAKGIKLFINLPAAAEMGITLPDTVIERADTVVK
ncbi:MAG: ABC transporter substrate-binding protein [Phormidesmis sp. RL_2_1]|nr:ABC transporter substrate-binding protein [Phormidesmis sp. RL_2_1]